MNQVKFFRALENDLPGLERQINEWLQREGVKVKHIFGNLAPQTLRPGAVGDSIGHGGPFAPSDVLIVVVFER